MEGATLVHVILREIDAFLHVSGGIAKPSQLDVDTGAVETHDLESGTQLERSRIGVERLPVATRPLQGHAQTVPGIGLGWIEIDVLAQGLERLLVPAG